MSPTQALQLLCTYRPWNATSAQKPSGFKREMSSRFAFPSTLVGVILMICFPGPGQREQTVSHVASSRECAVRIQYEAA